MLQHPWIELQAMLKEKGLTQKAFSSLLWKKISEVNELLKWKRNITIQWDFLLHQILWTPKKYRVLKQIDYEYSLIDTDEEETIQTNIIAENNIEVNNNEIDNKEPVEIIEIEEVKEDLQQNNTSNQEPIKIAEEIKIEPEQNNNVDGKEPDKIIEESALTPEPEQDNKIDQDRVKIFRDF